MRASFLECVKMETLQFRNGNPRSRALVKTEHRSSQNNHGGGLAQAAGGGSNWHIASNKWTSLSLLSSCWILIEIKIFFGCAGPSRFAYTPRWTTSYRICVQKKKSTRRTVEILVWTLQAVSKILLSQKPTRSCRVEKPWKLVNLIRLVQMSVCPPMDGCLVV